LVVAVVVDLVQTLQVLMVEVAVQVVTYLV
jgi:hypothetical protein